MTISRTAAMLLAASLALAGAAQAQGSDEGERRVNVHQFAISHPVPDTRLPISPSLGDSVPQDVRLTPAEGNDNFAYFYYAGQPVIVDLKTRSVVRIGQ